jgi:hypothetical protein
LANPTRSPDDPAGLDYLYKARKLGSQEPASESSSSETTSRFDASLQAYAYMRVLDEIRRQTDGAPSVRLSEVGQKVEMGPESLVPVAQRLREAGLVEVVEERWGDDAVRLSDRGRAVVDEGRDQELVALLGIS